MAEVILDNGDVIVADITAFAADLIVPQTVGLIPTHGKPAVGPVEAAPDITERSPALAESAGSYALAGV